MAQTRRRRLLNHIALLAAPLALVVGCQSNPMLVERVPPPNFNGPVVAQAPVTRLPAPTPLPVQKPPAVAKNDGGVPAAWIPKAPLRDWKWIVLHHSATPSGSAAVFDRMHKDKGWDELGYDFVIGNGTQSADGQIEVGPRWTKQKWGAHTKTPNNEFNDRGIGICLVGNFDEERPSAAQIKSLTRLTAYLMKTYRLKSIDIVGHGQAKATDCPGRYMNVAAVRRSVGKALAMGDGVTIDLDALAMELSKDLSARESNAVEAQPAGAELLTDISTEAKPAH